MRPGHRNLRRLNDELLQRYSFLESGSSSIVFVLAGVADGFGLIMGIGLAGGDANVAVAEMVSRYLLLVNIFLIVCYLISANYTSAISKLSIKELIVGPVSLCFLVRPDYSWSDYSGNYFYRQYV